MSSTPIPPVSLVPFAPSKEGVVEAVEVQLDRTKPDALRLRYVLHGDMKRIRVPQPRPSRQADELWKHTCFEAFLRAESGTAYHELNVSPSSEWAMYSFDDYRQGMAPAHIPQPPAIRVEPSARRLTIDVYLNLKMLPPSRALALSAVVEDDSGSLSYWALKHPAAKPDFHHAEGFALEL